MQMTRSKSPDRARPNLVSRGIHQHEERDEANGTVKFPTIKQILTHLTEGLTSMEKEMQ